MEITIDHKSLLIKKMDIHKTDRCHSNSNIKIMLININHLRPLKTSNKLLIIKLDQAQKFYKEII